VPVLDIRKTALACLAVFMIAIAGSPAYGNASDILKKLKETHVSSHSGVINGFELPIQKLDGPHTDGRELLAEMRKLAAGRATLTVEHTDISTVAILAPVRSTQCPSCPAATPENIEDIMSKAVVVTLITDVSPVGTTTAPLLAYASPAAAMLRALAATPKYTGDLLERALDGASLANQTAIDFGTVRTTTATLVAQGDGKVAISRIRQDLSRRGFSPVVNAEGAGQLGDGVNIGNLSRPSSDAKNGQGQEEYWKSKNRVVRVASVAAAPHVAKLAAGSNGGTIVIVQDVHTKQP